MEKIYKIKRSGVYLRAYDPDTKTRMCTLNLETDKFVGATMCWSQLSAAREKFIKENPKKFKFEEEKILFLIFINYHEEHNDVDWGEQIRKFENLSVDWWVKPDGGSHLGLAYQSILDTDDYNEAANEIAVNIYDEYDRDVLIVLSRRMVTRYEPVGQSTDKCWINVGRYFDELVRNNEKGIFIYY